MFKFFLNVFLHFSIEVFNGKFEYDQNYFQTYHDKEVETRLFTDHGNHLSLNTNMGESLQQTKRIEEFRESPKTLCYMQRDLLTSFHWHVDGTSRIRNGGSISCDLYDDEDYYYNPYRYQHLKNNKKKRRNLFSRFQTVQLEIRFREQRYLSAVEREHLASALNLTATQVQL